MEELRGLPMPANPKIFSVRNFDPRILAKQTNLPASVWSDDKERKTISRTVSLKDVRKMLREKPFEYSPYQIRQMLSVMGKDNLCLLEVSGKDITFFFRYKEWYCWLPIETAVYLSDHVGWMSVDIFIYLLNQDRMNRRHRPREHQNDKDYIDTYFSVSELCRLLGVSDQVRAGQSSYPRKRVEYGLATLRELGFIDWGEPTYVKGKGKRGKQLPLTLITDKIPQKIERTVKELSNGAKEGQAETNISSARRVSTSIDLILSQGQT